MRNTEWIVVAALFSLAACGGATAPSDGGGGGVSGGGGPVGQVIVGNIFFRSAHNGSQNPAVDTVAAGSSVTWVWNAAGSHSIQSTGTAPAIFRNSVVMAGANSTYSVTFQNPGTYDYDCGVHGPAMTGRIVVQ
jgi:plastocyanin